MRNNLKIGEKIKSRRLRLGITQNLLASDKVTRNMISLIENGKAYPSFETAEYLCDALDLPLAYLYSEAEDLFQFEKASKINYIKELFAKENYSHCITVINSLSSLDDELYYLLAYSYYNNGKDKTVAGELVSAEENLKKAIECSDKTIYNTDEIKACAPLYLSICQNIESPLLEFDSKIYDKIQSVAYDFEFYKYIMMDYEYDFKNPILSAHAEVKHLLKKHKYVDAIKKLKIIEEYKNSNEYNAFVFFGVYTDLEYSFKQIGDFENAYRYASKRLSMIKSFNS